jgi:hypothetical protein
VLIEHLIPSDSGGTFIKVFYLWMLVCLGGRERTLEEYRKLLEFADLQLTRVIPTQSLVTVIEAEPA